MAERQWFLLASGSHRGAVPREAVWGFVEGEAVRPLPGARSWCAGWVPVGGRLVPVVRGGASGWEGAGPVLAVVHWDEHQVALPCEGADLVAAEGEAAGEGGIVRLAPSGAEVLDLRRLYTALGIL